MADPRPLEARRILIVEDEYFIAADLRRALADAGADVVGPVASVAEALALVNRGAGLHGAILDVNLDGESSFPIAEALDARAIPFVFLTGYDDWALPEAWQAVRRLTKPCPVDRAIPMLQAITERSPA